MVAARRYLSRVKPKFKLRKPVRPSAPTTASPSTSTSTTSTVTSIPIRFSVNIVVPPGVAGPIARFLQADRESPFGSIDEVPKNLKPFIASSDELVEPFDDLPRSATFLLGEQYAVDRDGLRRAKCVEREVLNLQLAQQQQEAWEEYLAREPDEAVKAALADAHAAGSGLAVAQAQYQQKQREIAEQHAKQFVEEDQMIDDDQESIVSPTIEGVQCQLCKGYPGEYKFGTDSDENTKKLTPGASATPPEGNFEGRTAGSRLSPLLGRLRSKP